MKSFTSLSSNTTNNEVMIYAYHLRNAKKENYL